MDRIIDSSGEDSRRPSCLDGRLVSGAERPVYPDNYCIECVRAGIDSDRCFHKHWQTADEPRARETR
jgi:hypothetical protein